MLTIPTARQVRAPLEESGLPLSVQLWNGKTVGALPESRVALRR